MIRECQSLWKIYDVFWLDDQSHFWWIFALKLVILEKDFTKNVTAGWRLKIRTLPLNNIGSLKKCHKIDWVNNQKAIKTELFVTYTMCRGVGLSITLPGTDTFFKGIVIAVKSAPVLAKWIMTKTNLSLTSSNLLRHVTSIL